MKKRVNISLSLLIFILVLFGITLGLLCCLWVKFNSENNIDNKSENVTENVSRMRNIVEDNVINEVLDNEVNSTYVDLDDEDDVEWSYDVGYEEDYSDADYDVVTYSGFNYCIVDDVYEGEYDIQKVKFDSETNNIDIVIKYFNTIGIVDYDSYEGFCESWNLDKVYNDEGNYILISYTREGAGQADVNLNNVVINNNVCRVYMNDSIKGYDSNFEGYVLVIPISEACKELKLYNSYSTEEIEEIRKLWEWRESLPTVDKPIIYLYPEEEQEVEVSLGYEEEVTVSYPKYNDSWQVWAKSNGDLVDLKTGRNLYALYYESNPVYEFKIERDGFIVKGEDSAEFLEEKLAILGLNDREAEEFILYWLPKLEANKYNYIRFATDEEIAKNMPLEVSGNPDSVIRVLMTYTGVERPFRVREQKLNSPERNGFTVVEWGGTEIVNK